VRGGIVVALIYIERSKNHGAEEESICRREPTVCPVGMPTWRLKKRGFPGGENGRHTSEGGRTFERQNARRSRKQYVDL